MTNYTFESDQFALSENSFHLLRNGYNFETIDYIDVERLRMTKGRQIKNWFFVLIIGIGLSAFGIFTAIKVVYEFFFSDNFHLFYIEQFLLPIFPLLLGLYSLYSAIKTGPILILTTKGKTLSFPLADLQKESKIEPLTSMLNQHKYTKNIFTMEL